MKNLNLLLIAIIVACQPQAPVQEKADGITDQKYWYQQPLRILQTVMRQPDGAGYNTDSLVHYMKQVHANVLVVNGGGIVDFFQNTLPMSNVNPFIGDRDLLREIVEACHDNGIRVIARVDFRGVEKERYDLHPDWFARDENGKPIILNYTTPGLYAPCYNSYYRNEHAVTFIKYLFENYDIDGIWHNSVNFHHTCYCERCQMDYRKVNGKDIPLKTSAKEEWQAWYRWNETVANRQLQLMRNTVKEYGEDKSYAAEVFDLYQVEQQQHTGISLYSVADYFDFLVIVSFIADNKAQIEYKDIHYPSAIIRFLKSLRPEKIPVILFGGNGTEHRYIYDPPIDSRLWMWETVASGGGLWNCYFNGYIPSKTMDTRNAYITTDAYRYLDVNRQSLQNLRPVADIAVYYSKPSAEFVGDAGFSLPLKGLLRFLAEAHLQYGFITDQQLTIDILYQHKILFLPGVAAMSDAEIQVIADWVRHGGKVIATGQTSLFHENGKPRPDFGLAGLFGVNYAGEITNTEMDCYQKIVERTPLLDNFDNTQLLHNGGRTVLVHARPETTVVTGYLPKINNQPPENAFPASWDSEHPIAVINQYGMGRVIYFANEPDKLNYTAGHPDYHQLLLNAVNLLMEDYPRIAANAPPSVHVYLNRQDGDMGIFQLSVVNTTSGNLRPMRGLVPASGISISLPFDIQSSRILYKESGLDVRVSKKNLQIDNLLEFFSVELEVK